jgi:hypothetical protein
MKMVKSLIFIFFTLITVNNSIAQAIAVPWNSQGDKSAGTNSQNEPNEQIKEVQSNTIDIKIDEVTAQSNWKLIYREEALLEKELNQKNIKINVDSMFDSFLNKRNMLGGENKITLKIIPLNTLTKALRMDTAYTKKIIPQNKIYGILKLQPSIEKDTEIAKVLSAFANGFTINTYDLFTNVLPPYIVTDNDKTPIYSYRVFLETFFTDYPELLYNCSKAFQRKLELKQHDSLYNIHIASGNIIDLRSKTYKNQSNK